MPARACPLALTLLLFAAGTAVADPGPRPFRGRVDAVWDNVFVALAAPPARFQGGGPVTHMGRTTQVGTLTLEPGEDPTALPGYGTVTITAADGSTVTFDYFGTLDATTGRGEGAFTFTGGTGRFRRVRGGGTFVAHIDVSAPTQQAMTVVLDGRIDY